MTTDEVISLVERFGGQVIHHGTRRFNDTFFDFKATWSKSSDLDKFLEFFPPGVVKFDVDRRGSEILLFFTVRKQMVGKRISFDA